MENRARKILRMIFIKGIEFIAYYDERTLLISRLMLGSATFVVMQGFMLSF